MAATDDDEHTFPPTTRSWTRSANTATAGINQQILLGAEYIDFDDVRTRYNTASNALPPYLLSAGDGQPGQFDQSSTALYTSPSFLQNNKQNRRALSLASIWGLWNDHRVHVMAGVRHDQSSDTNKERR